MRQHAITAVIAAFWVAMNIALWRAETGASRGLVSSVPVEAVVQRMLTAADPSSLRISRQGRELGLVRWMPTVRERPADPDSNAPEGMVAAVTGYHLDVDISLAGETPDSRWHVLAQLDLDPRREWEELLVRLVQRPSTWEIRARQGEDKVHLAYEQGRSGRSEQTFSSADLAPLLAAAGPAARLLPPGLLPGGSDLTGKPSGGSPRIVWDATDDHVTVGKHRVRAYRLRGRLFEGFEVVIHVARSGEILRVELPDHYVLTSTGQR